MDKVKLFCFPYAGGASTIYCKWRGCLDANIELRAVELAGRGIRMDEPLRDSIDEIVEDIYSLIEKELDEPFAFFGHSMGSIIAYELSYLVFVRKKKRPLHVFFSGGKAPHLDRRKEKIHELPDEIFKRKIIDMGGTPVELLQYEELFNLFLPILRNDFKAVETYRFTDRNYDLGCDITVFNGKQDEITLMEIHEWKRHTSQKFTIHMFDGGHFFINYSYDEIVKIINQTLRQN